jgi:hypothetical protein
MAPPRGTATPGGGGIPGAGPAQGGNQQQGQARRPFQSGTQFGGTHQQPQQQINPKLIIDFNKLMQAGGAESSVFGATRIGVLMNAIGEKAHQRVVDVRWHANLGVWEATLGKVTVFYVTGLERRDSPIYKIPENVLPFNEWNIGRTGTIFTQEAWKQFDPNLMDQSYSKIFIYDDDVEQHHDALAYLISKCAFPEIDFGVRLTEDQYLNPTAGFSWVDSRMYQGAADELKQFAYTNGVSAVQVPAQFMFALKINNNMGGQFSFPFGQQPFGGGFGQQFNAGPFGGGFPGQQPFAAQNGGFGVNPYGQQQQTQFILAAVKYYVKTIDINGFKKPVVHITEIIENNSITAEGFLKHMILYFNGQGFGIAVEANLSKLTPNVRSQLSKYFVFDYGMYGGNPNAMFHDVVTYVHPESKSRMRYHSSYLSLGTFAKLHPDLAKSEKFPKAIATHEDAVQFENLRAKAGYVQVLDVGDIHLVFNDSALNYLTNDWVARQKAFQANMTLEEYVEKYNEWMAAQQQNPNQAQQNSMFGQQQAFGGQAFGQQPFGGGFGQPAFGGQAFGQQPYYATQQPQYPYGGQPPYYGPQQQPYGQQPYYAQPQQPPIWGNPNVGNSPYPNQAQGKKGQNKGGPQPYHQAYYAPQQPQYPYGGQPPYYGPQQPPYGAPPGGMPGMAGGAFPGGGQHPPQGSRYVPS